MRRRDFLGLGVAGVAGVVGLAGCTGDDDAPLTTPSPGPLVRVPARPADALATSYLINTKTYYAPTVYGYTDAVVGLVQDLGARTVRERVATGASAGAVLQQQAMAGFIDSGVRWHATVGSLENWADATAYNASVMDFLGSVYGPATGNDLATLLHSLGGCNEVDGPVLFGSRDPDWAEHARLMQSALWTQAKAHPLLRDLPIAGPSTRTDVTPERAAELGDLSAVCDWGNAHLYPKGGNPATSLDEQLTILSPVFPDVPVWLVTETGYNDSLAEAGRTVPEEAAATYAVRGICDYFARDAVYGRFELLDDPDPVDSSSQSRIDATSERQAHFGIVAMTQDDTATATPDTWRKKPEFWATKRLLGLVSDPGTAFRPDALELSVTGASSDLKQLLVQKRDGRHYLLLWRDVEVTQGGSRALIDVGPVRLLVSMKPERAVALHVPAQLDRPVETRPPRTSVVVDVAADLVVLEIG